MSNNMINNLRNSLVQGARTTKYEIQIFIPTIETVFKNDIKEAYNKAKGIVNNAAPVGITQPTPPTLEALPTVMAKATSFPAKTVNYVEVWTQGRKHLLQGDTEFEHEWTISFYENETHAVRAMFLKWQDDMDDAISNEMIKNYEGKASVLQLGSNDNASKASYTFHKLWPKRVGSIELSDESVNTIGTFEVTFAFDYWEKDSTPIAATTSS